MDIVYRHDGICYMSSNEVEDVYHFVIKCILFDDVRRQF